MKPEDLVAQLQQALAANLRSVILYGSAAAEEFVPDRSDFNVLVIVDRLGVPELKSLGGVLRPWVKAGHPPPLCFTAERLKHSTDVFPLELLDIRDRRRVLFGTDVVADLEISTDNLRHELEYELKSKLIQLRRHYLLAHQASADTVALMVKSLSTFLVLFRGAWRLFNPGPAPAKLEALQSLGRALDFRTDVFELVHRLRTGEQAAKEIKADDLFGQYLAAIEIVVDKVDAAVKPTSPSPEPN